MGKEQSILQNHNILKGSLRLVDSNNRRMLNIWLLLFNWMSRSFPSRLWAAIERQGFATEC